MIDQEKFLDFKTIERRLTVERWDRCPEQTWLADSFAEPRRFWKELRAWHDLVMPCASTPYECYDFYNDLVLRHARNESPALICTEPGAPQRGVSYRELGNLASRRAAAWRHAGVQPGQLVAIVRNMGLELATSVLAALKLGLVISVLPPQGPRFIALRLANLAPLHVDVDENHRYLLPETVTAVLPPGDAGEKDVEFERSFLYAAGSLVGMMFDPSSPTPALPVPLTADAAYLGAFRDGAIALGLRAGDAFAAPGADLLDSQPGMLLAGMLSGATLVDLTLEDVSRDPRLLVERQLKTVGVSARLRDLLLPLRPALGQRWASWFRNPAAPAGLERWHDFVAATGLETALAMNLRWQSALGGCVLFSPRRRGQAHSEVLPSAGIGWRLSDLGHDDLESSSGMGRLALALPGAADEAIATTANVVSRLGEVWFYAGSSAEGRQGWHYPVEEARAALEGLEGCCAVSMCLQPTGSNLDPLVVLMLFTGAHGKVAQAALIAAAHTRIETELGQAMLPDRTECFPLYPRKGEDGVIDHDWCREQYVTGGLARKSRDDFHRALSSLREMVAPYPRTEVPSA